MCISAASEYLLRKAHIFISNSVQVEGEVFKVPPLPDPFSSNSLMSFKLMGIYRHSSPFVLRHVPSIRAEGLLKENSSFWASASVRWDDWWMQVCAGNTNGRVWFRSLRKIGDIHDRWLTEGEGRGTEDSPQCSSEMDREEETTQIWDHDVHKPVVCMSIPNSNYVFYMTNNIQSIQLYFRLLPCFSCLTATGFLVYRENEKNPEP